MSDASHGERPGPVKGLRALTRDEVQQLAAGPKVMRLDSSGLAEPCSAPACASASAPGNAALLLPTAPTPHCAQDDVHGRSTTP